MGLHDPEASAPISQQVLAGVFALTGEQAWTGGRTCGSGGPLSVALREPARRIHPALLTKAGLRGAVQALAERSQAAATVTALRVLRQGGGR